MLQNRFFMKGHISIRVFNWSKIDLERLLLFKFIFILSSLFYLLFSFYPFDNFLCLIFLPHYLFTFSFSPFTSSIIIIILQYFLVLILVLVKKGLLC